MLLIAEVTGGLHGVQDAVGDRIRDWQIGPRRRRCQRAGRQNRRTKGRNVTWSCSSCAPQ